MILINKLESAEKTISELKNEILQKDKMKISSWPVESTIMKIAADSATEMPADDIICPA